MAESKPFVIEPDDVEAFEIPHHEDAVARELINPERGSEDVVFRLSEMGGRDQWHMHEDSEQLLFIRSGSGEIKLGEPDNPDAVTVHDLTPETFVYIPRRTHHQVTCTSEEPLTCIVVWTPPYESLEEWNPAQN